MMQEPDQKSGRQSRMQSEALASHRKPEEQKTLFLVLQAVDREPLLLAIGHLALEPILSPANDNSAPAFWEGDLVIDLGARRVGCVLLVTEVILLGIATTHGSAHGATNAGHPRV